MTEEGNVLPQVWIVLMTPLLRASTSSSAERDGAVIIVGTAGPWAWAASLSRAGQGSRQKGAVASFFPNKITSTLDDDDVDVDVDSSCNLKWSAL